MASILRVRAALSGWPSGGPGVSTHFFKPGLVETMPEYAQLAADRVKNSFIAGATLFFSGFRWTVESVVDEIDDTNGNVLSSIGVTGSTGVGGSGTGWGPTPVGTLVRWETATYIVTPGAGGGSRRLRGRTFLSPIDVSMLEGDGTPSANAITHTTSFANSMRDAGITTLQHVIWHRPSPGGTNGESAPTTGAVVPNKYAVLRSRRD